MPTFELEPANNFLTNRQHKVESPTDIDRVDGSTSTVPATVPQKAAALLPD